MENSDIVLVERASDGKVLATAKWVPIYQAIASIILSHGVREIPRDTQVVIRDPENEYARGRYGDLLVSVRMGQVSPLAVAA